MSDCETFYTNLRRILSRVFARWFVLLAAAWFLAPLAGPSPAKEPEPQFTSKEFLEPVKFLASDKLKGRGDGTRELDEAAQYIAKRFKKFGLKPVGDKGTYLQRFKITVGAQMGPNNSVTYQSGATRTTLTPAQDFVPFSFSEAVTVQAPLVFAGYGITAPEFNYDDYKGADAKGKIVLVLRHEPQENDEKSVFAGKQLTTHAEIVNKAINARNHGAVGMISSLRGRAWKTFARPLTRTFRTTPSRSSPPRKLLCPWTSSAFARRWLTCSAS